MRRGVVEAVACSQSLKMSKTSTWLEFVISSESVHVRLSQLGRDASKECKKQGAGGKGMGWEHQDVEPLMFAC